MDPGVGIGGVEKPLLQPVVHRDGVEGENDLFVIRCLAAQADVELVEVRLQQLRRLLDPDARDTVNGLELFHIVQSRKQNLGPILEADQHVAPVDLCNVLAVKFLRLCAELLKAGLPQRLCHLAADQDPVAWL